jgi:hypothetical protein
MTAILAPALGGEVTAVDSAVGLRLGERWRVGGVRQRLKNDSAADAR